MTFSQPILLYMYFGVSRYLNRKYPNPRIDMFQDTAVDDTARLLVAIPVDNEFH